MAEGSRGEALQNQIRDSPLRGCSAIVAALLRMTERIFIPSEEFCHPKRMRGIRQLNKPDTTPRSLVAETAPRDDKLLRSFRMTTKTFPSLAQAAEMEYHIPEIFGAG